MAQPGGFLPLRQAMRIPQHPSRRWENPGLPGLGTVPPDYQAAAPKSKDDGKKPDLGAANAMSGALEQQLSSIMQNISPQQMAQAQQAMQDPAFQAQMNQMMQGLTGGKMDPAMMNQMMQQMGQSGQLSPELMAQMTNPGGPGGKGKLSDLPEELKLFTPGDLAKIGLIACLLGVTTGWGVSSVMNHLQDSPSTSPMMKLIKWIENKVPVVKTWNSKMRQRYIKAARNPDVESAWVRMDAGYSPNQVRELFYKNYLGPKGQFRSDMQTGLQNLVGRIKHPGELDAAKMMTFLSEAKSTANLQKVLEADPLHFIPEGVRDSLSKQVRSIQRHNRRASSLQGILKTLFPKWSPKSMPEWLRSRVVYQKSMTLGHMDNIIAQHHFMEHLARAAESKELSKDIFEAIAQRVEGNYGKEFVDIMNKEILRNPEFRKALTGLKSLGGSMPFNSKWADFLPRVKSLVVGGKAIHVPIHEQLMADTKGLLVRSLNGLTADTTIDSVYQHFETHHFQKVMDRTIEAMEARAKMIPTAKATKVLTGRIDGFKAGREKMEGVLSGIIKEAKALESMHVPMIEGKRALRKVLLKNKTGPVGRAIAFIGFHIQRALNGVGYKNRYGLLVKESATFANNLLGSMGISIFIFGFALAGFFKSDKETRWARFTDNLATGLGGWIGWDFGHALTSELGIMRWSKMLSRINTKKMLPFLSARSRFNPTWGSFIANWIVPAIVGAVFSSAAQVVTHAIWGNPDKMDAKKKKEAEEKAKVKDAKKADKKGDKKDKTAEAKKAELEAKLSPEAAKFAEEVGLSPVQIADNQLTRKREAHIRHTQEHMPDAEHDLWYKW